jgi:hypothetical protein
VSRSTSLLIILEGSDRSGKSTLARALQDRIKNSHPAKRVTILNAGPPTQHPLDEYEGRLFDYRPAMNHDIICDRWHIGEQVYPRVFRRTTHMTLPVLAHIETFLQSRGALLVHVQANLEVLKLRLEVEQNERPDASLVNYDQLVQSHYLFATEIKTSLLPCIGVDTTSGQIADSVINYIINVAQNLDARASSLNGLHTYVGPLRPSLLLVGDVRHKYRNMNFDVLNTGLVIRTYAFADLSPALMPYPKTSGVYLLNAIDPLAIRDDYGFINANDVDDAHAAWKILGEPPTIALGNQAWAKISEWALGAVPHPQYMRRFYYNHRLWYSNLIKYVANYGGNKLSERPPVDMPPKTNDEVK